MHEGGVMHKDATKEGRRAQVVGFRRRADHESGGGGKRKGKTLAALQKKGMKGRRRSNLHDKHLQEERISPTHSTLQNRLTSRLRTWTGEKNETIPGRGNSTLRSHQTPLGRSRRYYWKDPFTNQTSSKKRSTHGPNSFRRRGGVCVLDREI